jgi:transcriptional regulator with XRE-family HTH domain
MPWRLSGLIKQRCTEMGISQRKLATRVGVSDAYIAQLDTRKRTNSSFDVLRRLAKAFKV